MPRLKLNLTSADLEHMLSKKAGIFSEELIQNTLKANVKADEQEVPVAESLAGLEKNFREFAKKSEFDDILNTGLYIRIKDLREKLDEFEAEKDSEGNGLSHVYVAFGLRKAKKDAQGKDADWNCLHLIFQGANPVAEFDPAAQIGKVASRVSKHQYSTYDGDEVNYIGPKPGCPPFGATK
ncbi:hypothetical protein [Spirosoma sp. KNUC1025]|uniref:hypothetical protein n=1 Tax=Spirosoma sp. KNUC1025 TaxID=2894082 RepID=UPI00386D76A4|nr:hypothetical protein LN737_02305 [Spirosoma sp. KNUC1025]